MNNIKEAWCDCLTRRPVAAELPRWREVVVKHFNGISFLLPLDEAPRLQSGKYQLNKCDTIHLSSVFGPPSAQYVKVFVPGTSCMELFGLKCDWIPSGIEKILLKQFLSAPSFSSSCSYYIHLQSAHSPPLQVEFSLQNSQGETTEHLYNQT